MDTLLNKSQNTTKECSVCANPPTGPSSVVCFPQRTCFTGLTALAELQSQPVRTTGESTLIRSQDLQSPPLVQFSLIICVEDHLVLVILMTTFDLQDQVRLEVAAHQTVWRDVPQMVIFASLR